MEMPRMKHCMQSMSFFQYKGQNYSRILGLKDQPVIL